MASRPKLAIVTSHPIQYNAPVFRALVAAGVELRVFYTWSQTEVGGQHEPGFGQAVAWDVPLLGGYDHEFVPNLAREPGLQHFRGLDTPGLVPAIERWGAGVLLVYGWNYRAHLQAMRHFHGRIPVLFRGDSTLLDPQPAWRRQARRLLLRWVYRHVDVALAVGQNSRDYFRWCGLDPGQVMIAPHCIDNARFAVATPAQQEQAEAWQRDTAGNKGEAPVLVFAGKFEAKKDPLLLVDAVRRLGGAVTLQLFGGGPLEPALRERAGHDPAIVFRGFANQSLMPAVYRSGDLLVLPSCGPGETWGLALNEAMASGRAVLASDRVGGTRDLVREGLTGWTFPARDSEALVQRLAEAARLGRPALTRMGEAASAHVAAWSVEASSQAIAQAIGLVEARRPFAVTLRKHPAH